MWLRTTLGWHWTPGGTWRSRIQAGDKAVRKFGTCRKFPVVRCSGAPWTHAMVSRLAKEGNVDGLREATTSPVLFGGALPTKILLIIAK